MKMSFSQKEFLQWIVFFASHLIGAFPVTLRGSSQYAIRGKAYTLICSVPDTTVLVRFQKPAVSPSTTPTIVGGVQVAGNGDCYNIAAAPPEMCVPDVCSCVSDGTGRGSEFSWTFTPDNSMGESTWFCVDFSNNESPRFTLQFLVPVTNVVLQNPPTAGSDMTVIEGISKKLVCLTSACRPSACVSWYIGETNYTSSSTQTVIDETGNLHITTSTLTFNPNRNMKSERINCSAYNYEDNIVTANISPRLNVQYPSANTATFNTSFILIKEGQNVSILCEVKGGNPKAQITWNCFGGTTTDVSTKTDSRSVITVTASNSQNGKICTCRGQHSLVIITPAQVTFNIKRVSPLTLRGSSQYAVRGKPYTLICSVPDTTVLVRFQKPAVSPSTTPTIVGGVQVAGVGDCYNIAATPPVICVPNVCSCVSDGAGKGSEFRWTFTTDNSRKQSTWFCVDFSNNESPTFTLQFVVPVTHVVLQNPPTAGSDLTVIEGVSTSLVCVTNTCRPSACVLWYIGVTNYTEFSNQTVIDETGNLHTTTSTLTFYPGRKMNGERLTCSAYNYEDNIVTANIIPRLNVKYPSDNTATFNTSSIYIKKGQTISILCEVKGGNPKAQITWNCFGGKTTDVSTKTDSRSVITVTASNSQNGKLCTCRGEHSLVIITPAQVTFKIGHLIINSDLNGNTPNETYVDCNCNVRLSPENASLSLLGQQTITEGQNLQPITCSATCNPNCSYSWLRQGDSTTIQGSVLRLNRITRDQDGEYTCTATNIFGEKSLDVTVVVNYKPGDSVTLNPPDENYIRNENDVLSNIACDADCNPDCRYIWMLPNKENITGPVLSLSTLKRDEQGTYTCVARNKVGESVKTVSVTVQYGPGESMTIIPNDVVYIKNENDVLPDIRCVAECRPSCSYVWILPNSTNTTGPVLSLSVLKPDEKGTYICVARNIVGESLKTVTVAYKYKPRESVTLNPPDENYIMNENDLLPNITCDADCNPDCKYVWMLPDKQNITGPVLSLSTIKRDSQGKYTCVAKNEIGESVKTFSITVQYGPGESLALFPSDATYIKNENDVLPDIRCVADCRPSCSYVWMLPSNTNTTGPVLSLSVLKRDEQGTYKCVAGNIVGEYFKTVTISVQYKVEEPAVPKTNTVTILLVSSVILFAIFVIVVSIVLIRRHRKKQNTKPDLTSNRRIQQNHAMPHGTIHRSSYLEPIMSNGAAGNPIGMHVIAPAETANLPENQNRSSYLNPIATQESEHSHFQAVEPSGTASAHHTGNTSRSSYLHPIVTQELEHRHFQEVESTGAADHPENTDRTSYLEPVMRLQLTENYYEEIRDSDVISMNVVQQSSAEIRTNYETLSRYDVPAVYDTIMTTSNYRRSRR